jgi:hypothetical protein
MTWELLSTQAKVRRPINLIKKGSGDMGCVDNGVAEDGRTGDDLLVADRILTTRVIALGQCQRRDESA